MNEILNLIPIAIGIVAVIVAVFLIIFGKTEPCEFGNEYCKGCVYYDDCRREHIT